MHQVPLEWLLNPVSFRKQIKKKSLKKIQIHFSVCIFCQWKKMHKTDIIKSIVFNIIYCVTV